MSGLPAGPPAVATLQNHIYKVNVYKTISPIYMRSSLVGIFNKSCLQLELAHLGGGSPWHVARAA